MGCGQAARERVWAPGSFDFWSMLLLGVSLVFQCAHWREFPLYLDAYYHLAAMRGFAAAGGWVGTAFWEYAPVGRPHVYPPFYHLLQLTMAGVGIAPLDIARFFEVAAFPVFLLVFWYITRRLYSAGAAFFFLILATSVRMFLYVLSNNIPATLAAICGGLAWYSLLRRRYGSAGVFLLFSLYSHSLIPWLFLGGIGLYCAGKARRAAFYRLTGICLAGAAPLVYHQLRYFRFIQYIRVPEMFIFEIGLLQTFIFCVAVIVLWKRRAEYRLLYLLAMMLVPFLITHWNRFFSGYGLLPFLMLAGIFLEQCRRQLTPAAQRLFPAAAFLLLHLAAPSIIALPDAVRVECSGSWLAEQCGVGKPLDVIKNRGLLFQGIFPELAQIILSRTQPGEIIDAPYRYVAGILSVLTGRPTASAMLQEVRPFANFDRHRHTALYVALRQEPGGAEPPEVAHLQQRYSFTVCERTPTAVILKNTQPTAQVTPIPAVIPAKVCFGIIGCLLALVILEHTLRRQPGRRDSRAA
ncbi:MAG: hypothetical protein NC924_05265 [Candidatus Omnitrophica bacterium]|nr:hypothetical protein [Candidatus Omnitrophota bacterium]